MEESSDIFSDDSTTDADEVNDAMLFNLLNISDSSSQIDLSSDNDNDEDDEDDVVLIDDDDDDDIILDDEDGLLNYDDDESEDVDDDEGVKNDNDEVFNILSDTSSNDSIEVRKIVVDSISTKVPEQKKIASNKIKISDQQTSINKNNVPIVLNSSKLHPRQKNNDSLTVENNVMPKTNLSLFKYKQTKKTSSSMPNVTIQPTTKNTLQSNTNATEMNYDKKCSNREREFNIMSSDESNLERVYMVPHKGVNCFVKNGEFKNQSVVKTESQKRQSIPSTSKTIQNNSTKKVSSFVSRVQKLPNNKLEMVPQKVTTNLDNVFKQNSGQEVSASLIENENDIGDSKHMKRSILQNRPRTPWKKLIRSKILKKKNNIPHTVTSKTIGVHDTIENDEMNTKTDNYDINTSSKSLTESDNSLGSSEKYGKITKNDDIVHIVTISPPPPKKKTKTQKKGINEYRISTEHNSDDLNATTPDENETEFSSQIHSIENIKIIPVKKKKNKSIPGGNDEFSDQEGNKDDGKPSRFVSCKYEYCEALVFEPESIENCYCSVKCQKLHSIHIESIEEHEKVLNPPIKPATGEKKLIEKSGRRTHKRKQLFKSSCSVKIARNNDSNGLKQFNSPNDESTKDNIQPSLNSHHEISSSEIEDADDIFYLKRYVDNEDLYIYMEDMLLESAPKKLFDRPFPSKSNPFRVGHKLEGIDPQHQALFCVMTVKKVCGYRIRLNFDGYPDVYDFWVNADCPDLFYSRWCEQNARTVQAPKNYERIFNWTTYLISLNQIPAPKWNFASTYNLINCEKHSFHVGNKLEALDKLTRTLPIQLICVATVADVLGNRIRIHFDGWTDEYDYWTDITSTNLHPINWCEKNGHILSLPNGYDDFKGKKPFKWSEYLKETRSSPVPENAFISRPSRAFSIDMTIEVVDLVVPSLIRIAKILEVRGDELKILYDGFDIIYAYWVENDSPDIHPVGWSIKTFHPITIPQAKDNIWSCKVIGCGGKSNANNSKTDHIYISDCPYKLESWKNAVAMVSKLPDRLKINTNLHTNTVKNSTSNIIKRVVEKEGKSKSNSKTCNRPYIVIARDSLSSCNNKVNSNSSNTDNNEADDCQYESDLKKKSDIRVKKIPDRSEIDIISHTTSVTSSPSQVIEDLIEEKKENPKLDQRKPKRNSAFYFSAKENIIDNKSSEQAAVENTEFKKNADNKNQFNNQNESKNPNNLRRELVSSVLIHSLGVLSLTKQGRAWTRHNSQLGVPLFDLGDPRQWSIEEVASYVDQIVTSNNSNRTTNEQITISQRFIDQEIDGEAFLIVTQDELMKLLKIPLGHALKIINAVLMLRQLVPGFDLCD